MGVVVVDRRVERGEVEAALVDLVPVPQAAQGRRAVAPVRRPTALEIIDADLLRRVQTPAGLREERRDVAGRAPRLVFENRFTRLCRGAVEAAGRSRRGGQGNK